MKKRYPKAAAFLAAVMTAASMSGCYLLPDEEEVLPPPVVKTSEVTYSTVTAVKKDLEKRILTTGIITAENQYKLMYEKQGGTIAKFYVRTGDAVKKGDPICELDTQDVDYQIKEKELYKKRAQLNVSIIKQNGGSVAEIDRAGVEVELLTNELNKLYEKKKLAVLRAPVDGVVSYIADVKSGDNVGTGQSIATVIDTSSLYIPIKPSSNIALFKIGTELQIKVGETQYAGEVFMNPTTVAELMEKNQGEHNAADNTGIKYELETIYVRFKDTVPTETVGQLADCILVQDKVTNAIVISNNLIKTVDGQDMVYVLKEGSKVPVYITVGLKTGSQSEIVSGLSEGDEIILN